MTVANAVLALAGVVFITTALAVVLARDSRATVRATVDVAARNVIVLTLIAAALVILR